LELQRRSLSGNLHGFAKLGDAGRNARRDCDRYFDHDGTRNIAARTLAASRAAFL
jgi:hypothetical protein